MSVCDFDCLFVNMITPEPLEISSRNFQGIILGSKGWPSSKMAIVGCAAGGLTSDVLLCNVGATWRMMLKQFTHTITERCADGEKMSTAFHLQSHAVWYKKSPLKFSDIFFPNGWQFLVQILHAYYTFLSTLDYKFLLNYLQLWRSYAILSATTIICAQNVHHRPIRTLVCRT